MGMYTELHFNSELNIKKDSPIANVLNMMLGGDDVVELPDHELFKTDRWQIMLQMDSYHFDADTHSTLRWDSSDDYYLCIRCNLKNYDSEIEKFIDWIMPYCAKYEGDFLGFYRYEEDEEPTLIYSKAPHPTNLTDTVGTDA